VFDDSFQCQRCVRSNKLTFRIDLPASEGCLSNGVIYAECDACFGLLAGVKQAAGIHEWRLRGLRFLLS
jgi:hypothetical protein